MKIDRNAPCPCGSGKKYKKCCYGKAGDETGSSALQDIMAEIKSRLEKEEFSSIEEAQAVVDTIMRQRNSAASAEFHGLSPEQMHRVLHFPFDSPTLIRFGQVDAYPPTVPVLTLLSLLVDGIGEKGLTPTATGNLPRLFCREAALAFWGEEKYKENTRFGDIRSEMDFFDMHCLRLVAELAGLVRKYKGKFILTAKCRKQIAAHGVGAVYPDLFMAYAQKFNWGYRDRYQEIPFFQQAFLFTLFLLQKYGGESRPQSFYEDIFLQAFPDLFRDVQETSYQSVEETIRNAYFYRTLVNFAEFFGLAELVKISGKDFPERYEVKKLPLLDQLVSFAV
jgi:hypothetical protein